MRHARADDLGPVAQLLEHLRSIDGLAERSAGTFYRDSSAFLHFHVDSTGLFADVKADGEFERFRVSTVREQQRMLASVRRSLRLSA